MQDEIDNGDDGSDDLQIWSVENEVRLKEIAHEIYTVFCSGVAPTEEQKQASLKSRPSLKVNEAMAVAGYVLLMILSNLDGETRMSGALEFGTALLANVARLDEDEDEPADKGPH